jgi:cytochrome P450
MLQRAPRIDDKVPYRRGLPLLGDLLELRKDRVLALDRIRKDVGSVAGFNWGPVPVLLVSEPELAYKLLVEQPGNFRKGVNYRLIQQVTGAGLLVTDGEPHRRSRKLLAPAFTRRALDGYVATMGKVVGEFRDRSFDGMTFDVFQKMLELTLTVVARALFSLDPGPDLDDLLAASEVANAWTSDELSRLFHWPLDVPLPRHLRLRRARGQFDALVTRLVAARRAVLGTDRDPGDALSRMLTAKDDVTGEGLTDAQIRDEVVTLLLAGHETIASALTWTLYLLAQHADVRRRMEAEARAVLGDGLPRSLEDVAKLKYTLQVFKESMRVFPPLPYVSRRAARDVELGDYRLTEGQAVVCFIYGIHRRGDLYPDPERFDPDRFTAENEGRLPKGAYLPFGLGSRICIGNHFALTEAAIILATLAARLRFDLVPGQKIEAEALVSLRPKGEVRMTVRQHPREPVTTEARP